MAGTNPASDDSRALKLPPKVGPRSRADSILAVDGRSDIGRLLRAVRCELADHLGGEPTLPQRLLIELIAVKVVRLKLQLERGFSEGDSERLLSWQNSLRRDLESLGLERRSERVPTLQEYLTGKTKGQAA